jgi:DNA polymerase (family 10)
MENQQIADALSLLSQLSDIHGENSFKSKAYSSAAFVLEKLTAPVSELPIEKIATIKGIGSSSAQKIGEMLATGSITALESLISQTPPGVIEMLNIKGIGPKKINTIWKEMEIETIGELLYACKENRLKLYKGFGEKTQQNITASIEFYFKHKDLHLYAQIDEAFPEIYNALKLCFPDVLILPAGAFHRQMEIIETLDFLAADSIEQIAQRIEQSPHFEIKDISTSLLCENSMGIAIRIHPSSSSQIIEEQIRMSSDESFLLRLQQVPVIHSEKEIKSEDDFFSLRNMSTVPACMREDEEVVELALQNKLPDLIENRDIRGIIHSHSNWSDGSHSIEEMVKAAIEKGYEYLVISDHSQSAFYAQGLTAERVIAQHKLIDELNKKFQPFRIFKSIESDILNDGSLDYTDDLLKSFDLIIASVHSNLKMNEEKAMMRLMKAIENPFTTILGHMTGRLLLSRKGYPVDHEKIIDACAANDVVIELNANPSRLDIDWRYIKRAIKKNVLISINPDAHVISGYDDVRYGIKTAQKAGLSAMQNLSSFSREAFIRFLERQSQKH